MGAKSRLEIQPSGQDMTEKRILKGDKNNSQAANTLYHRMLRQIFMIILLQSNIAKEM